MIFVIVVDTSFIVKKNEKYEHIVQFFDILYAQTQASFETKTS